MLRATLKSLLSRKLRLVLSGMAVVLGVAFVSGAFILTDSLGKRFDALFETLNADVAVVAQPRTDEDAPQGDAARLTQATLDAMAGVAGVDKAYGDVSATGIIPFDERGEAIRTAGPPQLGVGFDEDDDQDLGLLRLSSGEAPQGPGEVALTEFTAERGKLAVGDRIQVFVPREKKSLEVTVSGLLVYSGDRPSLAGETIVAFDTEVAQRYFYGAPGRYSTISVSAEDGVSETALRDRIAPLLPAGFEARTGTELAEAQASEIKEGLGFFSTFLLVFAAIALFVGAFIIFNTFTMLVAQRTRELALFRAMGASRGQVNRSVLLEAVIVGLIGSTLGLALGFGIAFLLQLGLDALGTELPGGALLLLPRTVLAAFVVGVVVTAVAAVVPAVRASRVPPVAAMRDAATPDKSLTVPTLVGSVVAAAGVAAVGVALTGIGDATLPVLGVGVLLTFLGVAGLSPLLSRPVVGGVGRLLSWGTPSRLGRRNAGRNPRRTAVTSAALMIGLALVSAVSVLGASLKESVEEVINGSVGADVIMTTQAFEAPSGQSGFDPAVLDRVRELDGVEAATAIHVALAAVDGKEDQFVVAADTAAAGRLFGLKGKEGEVTGLDTRELAVDENLAKDEGWTVGTSVPVTLPKGGRQSFTVAGIYEENAAVSGVIVPLTQVPNFDGELANQGFVTLRPGADAEALTRQISELLKPYPAVSVADRSDFIRQQTGQVDQIVGILTVLLVLAVLIALLGIVNTLALSVIERTRELGMLRAVGLSRTQTKRMVRTEAVIIAVFGAVLGLVLGTGLGAAVAYALREEGVTSIAFPWVTMTAFLLFAVVAGIVAAWWPALRASRLDVLKAIATE